MDLKFRDARHSDLPWMVKMLAEDKLGANREDSSLPINQRYVEAFKSISDDSNNELIVVEIKQQVIGMLQLTFIPYLTHIGSWRCLVEGVRIQSDSRGQGLGKMFLNWAIDRAKERDCSIVQLTSDKQRPDALSFYESLGFKATHQGFKLKL